MPKKKTKSGFTLIELLMVIVIITILTGMIIGIANLARRKSNDAKARADIQKIVNSLEEYRIVYGEYPPTLATMKMGATQIADQFKEFSTDDRWSNPYVYSNTTAYLFTLFSEGPTTNAGDNIDAGTDAY